MPETQVLPEQLPCFPQVSVACQKSEMDDENIWTALSNL